MRINYRALFWSVGLSLPIIAITSLLIIQQHESSRRWMANYLSEIIQEAFDCQFSMRIEDLRAFPLTLTCSNVSARPTQVTSTTNHWQWHCDTISFQCSWLSLLLLRSLKTNITIDHLDAQTTVTQDEIAILDHIKKLFAGKKGRIPLIIKTLKLHNASIKLDYPDKGLHASIEGTISSKRINNNVYTDVLFTKGMCSFRNQLVASLQTGVLNSVVSHSGHHHATGKAAFNIAPLPKATGTCTVTGTLDGDIARYTMSNEDHTLSIQAITHLTSQETKTHGAISSELIKPFLVENDIIKNFQDTVHFQATLNASNLSARGSCSLQRIPLQCSWRLGKNIYQLHINNNAILNLPSLPGWKIAPHKLSLEIKQTAQHTSEVAITAEIRNEPHQKTITCAAFGKGDAKNFSVSGHCGNYPLTLKGAISPCIVIKEARLGAANKPLLCLQAHYDQTNTFKGTLDYAQLLALLDTSLAQIAPGNGIIRFDGKTTSENITCNITLCNANIVVKKLFNVITHASCSVTADWHNKQLTVNDLSCIFQRGTLTSKQITGRLTDEADTLFIHAPVHFQECLIKCDQALMLISGGLTLTYHWQAPSSLEGLVIIDKAHIEDITGTTSFFPRQTSPKTYISIPLMVDMAIFSKKSIRIRTPELHTKACPSLTLRGPADNLRLNGSVNLHGGAITFPYRSLKIVRGSLYATPEHSLDPLIDLQAKAQIDQHTVNLHLTGSLDHPVIHLESTPPLSEEQIAGLLITGSCESLLNATAPGFVLDNIAHYIAGTIVKMSEGNQLLANLIKPLKHIHVIPLINEQSGQQNIGGALEIDLGKRLKAKVQKNLTFDDDAALEIDYHLTDDVSVKAFKNDQGDLGSLLQMRLKF